ncbi:putative defense protein 1 [Dysidea avara]|uniref:putative defense protein 1 n=1 Tax=Dysidea avara TaxID=196820 RepID=UPI00331D0462
MKVYITLIACLLLAVVEGRRLGAPIFACGDVTDVVPNHSGTSISTDPFPYCVDLSQFTNSSYIPGENYSITLRGGSTNVDFKGFMIQGRVMADDSRTGTYFVPANNSYYQTQCDNETAATHTNNTEKTYVRLYWTAPPAGTGTIRFRYAMVDQFSIYWADLWTYPICEGQCNDNSTTPMECPVIMMTTTTTVTPTATMTAAATPTPTGRTGGGAAGMLASTMLILFMTMLAIN